MLTVVFAHVDQLGGLSRGADGGLDDRVGCAYNGDHCAICGLAGIDVEQTDAFHSFNLVGDLFDEGEVAAFAEVRDTLDQLLGH